MRGRWSAEGKIKNKYKCRVPNVYVVVALYVFLITCLIQNEIPSPAEVDNLFSGFHLSQKE